MQNTALVVSENAKARESLAEIFRSSGYSVTLSSNSSQAMQVARTVSLDVAIIESRSADARARRLRSRVRKLRPRCRVLILTSFGTVRNSTDILRFGSEDYVIAGAELLDLLGKTERKPEAGVEAALHERSVASLVQVLDVLVGLLELGDRFFAGGSHQVMRLARAVAEELGVDNAVLRETVIGALLRDIGKAGVDPAVFRYEGQHTEELASRMREHVIGSVRLLAHVDFPWRVLPTIRHHHERYDGRGYPDGLKGREIPLGARIIAVVEAYVAMISDRPHRPSVSPDEALEDLERLAGSHFDPEVVEVFMRVVEKQHVLRSSGAKPLVFVVDANDDFRRLLDLRLLNEGFAVEAATSVDEALEGMAGQCPSLILASADEDAERSFQFLREVRSSETTAHVPFAFLCETADRMLKIRALRQGVDDFLLKSDDMEELIARVENILARESARRGGPHARRRRGITGQIENLSLPDIVQTLAIGLKTAKVTLESDRHTGKTWFKDGAIVHATADEREGEEAFFEMLRWKTGEFSIEHGIKARKRSIENDPMYLVMEGLRRMDEAAATEHEAAAS